MQDIDLAKYVSRKFWNKMRGWIRRRGAEDSSNPKYGYRGSILGV
jgi:hypothetical protein